MSENENTQRVYFVRNGNNQIKIGYSGDVAKRLQSLKTEHGPSVELLGLLEGGFSREQEIHDLFASTRLGSSEWFEESEELLKFIEEHTIMDVPPSKKKLRNKQTSGGSDSLNRQAGLSASYKELSEAYEAAVLFGQEATQEFKDTVELVKTWQKSYDEKREYSEKLKLVAEIIESERDDLVKKLEVAQEKIEKLNREVGEAYGQGKVDAYREMIDKPLNIVKKAS